MLLVFDPSNKGTDLRGAKAFLALFKCYSGKVCKEPVYCSLSWKFSNLCQWLGVHRRPLNSCFCDDLAWSRGDAFLGFNGGAVVRPPLYWRALESSGAGASSALMVTVNEGVVIVNESRTGGLSAILWKPGNPEKP